MEVVGYENEFQPKLQHIRSSIAPQDGYPNKEKMAQEMFAIFLQERTIISSRCVMIRSSSATGGKLHVNNDRNPNGIKCQSSQHFDTH